MNWAASGSGQRGSQFAGGKGHLPPGLGQPAKLVECNHCKQSWEAVWFNWELLIPESLDVSALQCCR